MSANSRLPWPPWFNFRFTKRNNAALSSRPPMLDITRFELPTLPLRRRPLPPEYTRHRHLPVTLSDTFSTSVLLQLPLSTAALSPIWPCYKTHGDRFGTPQSLNYRDRSEQPFARAAYRRATTWTLRFVAWLAIRRSERSQAPDTNNELSWQTEIQFSASVHEEKSDMGYLFSPVCQTWAQI